MGGLLRGMASQVSYFSSVSVALCRHFQREPVESPAGITLGADSFSMKPLDLVNAAEMSRSLDTLLANEHH